MSRRFLLLSLIALPLAELAADPVPVPRLSTPTVSSLPMFSLEDSLRAALADNPALALAEDDVALARARLRSATVNLFPAVRLKAEETRGKADLVAQTPSFVERLYGVQVTQPVFHGGRRWSLRRQSRLRLDTARLQKEKERNDLLYRTAETHWRVVHLEAARGFFDDACRLLQEDLERASRRELGPVRAARIELLSTRSQTRECEIRLEEASMELLEARERLLDLMGRRNTFSFTVPAAPDPRRVETDEDECVRLARRNRAEIALAEASEETARWGRRAAAALASPRVDVNGFYGRSGSAFIETEPFEYQKDWNAGVRLSWSFLGNTAGYSASKEKTSPKLGESSRTETESQSASLALGDSFQNAIEARESRKELRAEQWRLDQVRRDVERDVRLAVRKAALAWKRVETADARLEQSLQEYRDVRHLLEDDRAHLGDLAAVRLRIAAGQAARAQAASEYHAAVANLNRAVGIPGHFRSVSE